MKSKGKRFKFSPRRIMLGIIGLVVSLVALITWFNNAAVQTRKAAHTIAGIIKPNENLLKTKPSTQQRDIDNRGYDVVDAAKLYLHRGDKSQALKCLQRAIHEGGARTVARAFFYKGEIAASELLPCSGIITNYEQAISIYPWYGASYVGCAECYKREADELQSKGDVLGAKEYLANAIAMLESTIPLCDDDVIPRARSCEATCKEKIARINEIYGVSAST